MRSGMAEKDGPIRAEQQPVQTALGAEDQPFLARRHVPQHRLHEIARIVHKALVSDGFSVGRENTATAEVDFTRQTEQLSSGRRFPEARHPGGGISADTASPMSPASRSHRPASVRNPKRW